MIVHSVFESRNCSTQLPAQVFAFDIEPTDDRLREIKSLNLLLNFLAFYFIHPHNHICIQLHSFLLAIAAPSRSLALAMTFSWKTIAAIRRSVLTLSDIRAIGGGFGAAHASEVTTPSMTAD